MGRTNIVSYIDDHERIMRKRNAVCTSRLLQALRLNHGTDDLAEPVPYIEPDSEPEPTPIPDPIPALPCPILSTISANKVEQIKRLVCRRYNISKAGIESSSRKMNLVYPRQIGMYLARKCTTHSFPEIGRRFGGRDHTTILHACKKIAGLAASNEVLAGELAEIQAELPA